MRRHERIALLVLCLVVVATTAAAARPRLGVTGAAQLTELAPRSYDGIGRPEVGWMAAGLGGVIAEFSLGGAVLSTGLEYGGFADLQRWGIQLDSGGTLVTGATDRQLRMRVLSMPARLEWRHGSWRLGAGPEARYLVSADQRWQGGITAVAQPNLALARGRGAKPAAQIFESVSLGQWQDATYLYRRWSLAAQVAVGREFPLGSHALRADLRWSEGITDQQWAPTATQRTRAAQLVLGLLW